MREHPADGRSTERIGTIAIVGNFVYKLHIVLPTKRNYQSA